MDIKRILLPEQIDTDEELYYRRSNTYFNSFSTGKWKKYTVLEQLELALELQGNFCVSLKYHWLERGRMETRVLTEANVSADKPQQFVFHFGENRNTGMFSFSCRSMMDGGKILGGKYFASNMVPVNLNINFAAAICTYRKEEFVERNLRVLKKAILENLPCIGICMCLFPIMRGH